MKTSFNSRHRHSWNKNKKFTTTDSRHNHRISLGRMLALPNYKGGHKHNLLKEDDHKVGYMGSGFYDVGRIPAPFSRLEVSRLNTDRITGIII